MQNADLSVFDGFADAIIATDASGCVTYLNGAAERLLGWDAAELVGQPLTALMPGRMQAAHQHGMARYFATGQPHIMGRPVRVPALTRQGEEVDVELALSPWRSPGGGPTVVAVMRDLRERLELESRLQAQRFLQLQHDVMRALAGAEGVAQAAACVLEQMGRVLRWEVGLWWEPTAGATHLRLRHSWRQDDAGLASYVRRCEQLRLPIPEGPSGRAYREATPVWLEARAGEPPGPASAAAGEAGLQAALFVPVSHDGVVLAVLEFGHRDRLPADPEMQQAVATVGLTIGQFLARLQALQAAREAVGVRDDFIAVASHELRTPLTSLMLVAQHMARWAGRAQGALDAGVVQRRLDTQVTLLRRMQRLTQSLLDVSRFTRGQLELHPERVDMVALCGEVVRRFADDAAAAATVLTVTAPPALLGMWDPLRLDQVVSNLLANALKFGRGRPVELQLEDHGGEARLAVRDHGDGIDAADQARIFERYEQVAARRVGGFGLGLWISRQIVEAMGGSLTVTSQPRRGATFSVRLPRDV